MKLFCYILAAVVFASSVFAKPKNVLLLISDDLRPELNCYGAKHMVTPNIDQLAEAGTLFARAYVQQPVCTASRASFLTGLRPNQTGSDYPYSIYTVEELFEGDRPSIPMHFMNEGYYVRCLGKIHHGYKEHYTEKSFSARLPKYTNSEMNKLKKSERVPYESGDVADESYQDGANTLEAIKTLRRMAQQEKPFFLGLGFYEPHLPWCSPKKYWELYERNKIPLSPNPDYPENGKEYASTMGNLEKYKIPESPNHRVIGDQDLARLMKHAYAASVSYMDANVGRILSELDALGLREDTVVMLISDHGWHLGDQNHWGKSTNYERSNHAPMIVSASGYQPAQRTRALVEYVDIFPTLCELSGLSVPTYLEGNSLVPLLEDPDRVWKSAVFSQYPRGYPRAKFEGYTIRTDRFHYIEWRELDGSIKGHELYDHKLDSNESVNRASDPLYRDVIEDLKEQLNAGWKAALPEGIYNHSNNPAAPEFVPWGDEAKFGPYAQKNKAQ